MPPKPRAPSLNSVGYKRAVKVFERLGYVVVRQKGSHIVMSKPGELYNIVIPAHTPLAEGTLRNCIKLAGLTPAQFVRLLAEA